VFHGLRRAWPCGCPTTPAQTPARPGLRWPWTNQSWTPSCRA